MVGGKRLEEWRDVVGYEGAYQVSSLGKVKGLARTVEVSQVGRRFTSRIPERVLAQTMKGDYLSVALSVNGIKKNALVHQLVASAFLGKRPDGYHTCHGVAGRVCNRVDNLRYDTPANNAQDTFLHGTNPAGERNGRAKLSLGDVEKIREDRKNGETLQSISEKYSISKSHAGAICSGKKWEQNNGNIP